MKKVVDDPRLIYKCCYLYYKENLSQAQICDQLGVSRATVSRLLKAGREKEIVRIDLYNPDSVVYGKLEQELEQRFGLKEIIIVDELEVGSDYEHMQQINQAAIDYLSRTLHEGDYVGVGMGHTLYNIATQTSPVDEINCTFVPVNGGIGTVVQSSTRGGNFANDVANAFAQKFHGNAIQFFAPAIFDDINVMKGLNKEQPIKQVTSLFKKLDFVIMGLGTPRAKESTIVRSGYLTEEQFNAYQNKGAVGDYLLNFFDINGDTSPFHEFNSHVMGISEEDFMNIRTRIAIAAGADKGICALGALKAHKINVLITDINCINRLLEALEKEERMSL